ncbi:MH2 domain protein [Dictyocaulus viviparus]|uniref:Mothers against decapentaplegic homolog n=1 Tax=Dictyocaulus viviparus TaxID=29172 RepID=A0A0D8XX39_DICVI|nr:MH2 domain protein [Dictyocaulus viviparus]
MISSEASLGGTTTPSYFNQPRSQEEYMQHNSFAQSSYSYQPNNMLCGMQQSQSNCFGNFPFSGVPPPPHPPPQHQPQPQISQYQQPPHSHVASIPYDNRRLPESTSMNQNIPTQSQMMHNFLVPTTNQALPPPFVFLSSGTSNGNCSQTYGGASAVDSCQQISHVLQCYQQGGEDTEFVRKAIESLVKKLKEKRVELDALITAITSAGKQPTTCVTIQRSLDGRLQVAGRKGVPHVVYARIWRWPNVNKNELVKLSMCTIPAEHQDFICINPYHYERVVSNGLTSPDLKPLRLDAVPSSNVTKSDYSMQDYEMAEVIPNSNMPFIEWSPSCALSQQESYTINHSSTQGTTTSTTQHYDLTQVQLPTVPLPEDWCSIIYYELDTQIGETFKIRSEEVRVDGGMDPLALHKGRLCLGALPNVHRGEVSERTRLEYRSIFRIHIGDGVELRALPSGDVLMLCRSHKPIFIRSGFLDFCHRIPYSDKPHRFTQENEATKIFDLRWAYHEMVCRTRSASEAVMAQAAAVAGFAPGVENFPEMMADSGVDGMRRAFCTVAISFVKGWGPGYPSRHSIKDTPCWIEIQLHRPLQLLDYLLKHTPLSN